MKACKNQPSHLRIHRCKLLERLMFSKSGRAVFSVYKFDLVLGEGLLEVVDVGAVAGLDGAEDVDAG